jgi:hypothetical protein
MGTAVDGLAVMRAVFDGLAVMRAVFDDLAVMIANANDASLMTSNGIVGIGAWWKWTGRDTSMILLMRRGIDL